MARFWGEVREDLKVWYSKASLLDKLAVTAFCAAVLLYLAGLPRIGALFWICVLLRGLYNLTSKYLPDQTDE